jgi:predicted transcriptional regulator of viral defense system
MGTKNIILSRKDAVLLEAVIARYGRIVGFEQLKEVFKESYSFAEIKNRVSLLAKLGWLVRIKKGLYVVVTDIGILTTSDVSFYTICQALNKDSYISFESALQYHGMFDQMLSTVGAITFKKARKYSIKDTEIRFFKIKKELYFGFSQERSDIGLVNIARKEKALLDILYFRSNAYYVSLVWEKLKNYKRNIDFNILKQYAKKFNLSVIRQIGFFLNRLDIDAQDLREHVKGKTSYSKMTKESKDFDAEWRLYFDHSVIE